MSSDPSDSVRSNLSCADPATGAIRASETTDLESFVVFGRQIYGFVGADLVVITPPAVCFQS